MTKWFEEIDSTNNKMMADKAMLDDKSIYATRYQTSGKGQRGNVWHSDKGENLLFSILFKPDNILSSKQFIISEAVTLGIVNYLSSFGIEAKIKWPNDIYVKDLKICGILMENGVIGDKLSYSIVGIGLNLNQKSFSGVPNPTSVALQKKIDRKLDIEEELTKLTAHIIQQYERIQTQSQQIENEYLEKMYRRNELHLYKDVANNSLFDGKITGIDNTSCLLIETTNGEIKRFAFKEISYVLTVT